MNRPAFLPFTVRSLVIEVVQDFDMTTHTPGVPATMRVVPSPSFPCAASEYALMFQQARRLRHANLDAGKVLPLRGPREAVEMNPSRRLRENGWKKYTKEGRDLFRDRRLHRRLQPTVRSQSPPPDRVITEAPPKRFGLTDAFRELRQFADDPVDQVTSPLH